MLKNYWKSILSLAIIIIGFVFNIYWIWGIFFLLWAINDLRNGYTYLMDEISKKEAPMLYWTVILMWIFFAITSIFPSYILKNSIEVVSNIVKPKMELSIGEDSQIKTINYNDPKRKVEKTKIVDKSVEDNNAAIFPELSRKINDEKYNYSFAIPNDWITKTWNEDDVQYRTISDPDGYFNVTFSSFSSQWKLSLKELKNEIEKESSKAYPFFDFSKNKDYELSLNDVESNKNFGSYIINGKYDNVEVVGINCYKIEDKNYHNIIAVFPDDEYLLELVKQIISAIHFG